jgi:hypothetical protein
VKSITGTVLIPRFTSRVYPLLAQNGSNCFVEGQSRFRVIVRGNTQLGPAARLDGEILKGDSGEPCTEEICGERGGERRAEESEHEERRVRTRRWRLRMQLAQLQLVAFARKPEWVAMKL